MTCVGRPCWLRFLRDFQYLPSRFGGRVSISYKSGRTRFVNRECAEKALAAGAAVPTTSPRLAAHEPPAVHRTWDGD